MASPFKTPLKTERLSLLSSDIEENLGLIDLNDPLFDFISKEEYWLFEDFDNGDSKTYDLALEWINSSFSHQDHDPYFDIKSNHNTPSSGLGRFDYLTKSVSRTATITRRKLENDESAPTATTPRFGTITKRVIPPRNVQDTNIANRTYEILQENGNLSDSNSDSSMLHLENSHSFTRPSNMLPNRSPINTNTITKNRRTPAISSAMRFEDSLESDFIRSVANDSNSNNGSEELTSDDIRNNCDLTGRNHPLNRTYDKTDFEDSSNVSTNGETSRNYPTISRNITRTLIRREASQGNINYSNQLKQPQPQYTTSNDDLLSDSSSVHSGRSNLTMTSSMSGRSEPNLAHNLSIHGLANQNKKLPTRTLYNASKQIQPPTSKIARPTSQNGPVNGVAKKTMSKLPSSSNAFGSMNSLQSGMARASNQIRHPSLWNTSEAHKSQQRNSNTKVQARSGLSKPGFK